MAFRAWTQWCGRVFLLPAMLGWVLFANLCVPASGDESSFRRPGGNHVAELDHYLRQVQIAEPVRYRHLAVYPLLLRDGVRLAGNWLTLDAAMSCGVLSVSELADQARVPVVVVKNNSTESHIFIMAGEVLSGGKQTRTIRNDVVLAPGQRAQLGVFCVEAHRWQGGKRFTAADTLLPQSIQKELRKGAGQKRVWSEVARNNKALGATNDTASLDVALKSKQVRDRLSDVRRTILPEIPHGTDGFLFVSAGRALGAEFFGRAELARQLLPKLLDSYAIDCVLPSGVRRRGQGGNANQAAIALFERIRSVGSLRTATPGSGAGIRTRSGGLLGDGVSLSGTVVHYGIQIQDRIVPLPRPIKIEPRIPRQFQR